MRRTQMKRSGFRALQAGKPVARDGTAADPDSFGVIVIDVGPPPTPATTLPLRRGTYTGTTTAPAPKENVLHSAAYQAAVRTLPCARCGIVGFTQFCNADMDKGTGIKTDDRRGWAGCGPHGNQPGCHWLIGTSSTFPKPVRRALEFLYAAWTRARILELGLWPKRLPMLEEMQS